MLALFYAMRHKLQCKASKKTPRINLGLRQEPPRRGGRAEPDRPQPLRGRPHGDRPRARPLRRRGGRRRHQGAHPRLASMDNVYQVQRKRDKEPILGRMGRLAGMRVCLHAIVTFDGGP